MEDDWDDVKANVKQLVKALRSLDPQPVKSTREFEPYPEIFMKWLRPTPQRLEGLVDILLSMFVRNKCGEVMMKGLPIYLRDVVIPIGEVQFPQFAGELTLRLSVPPREVKPAELPDDKVAELRKHLLGLWNLKAYEGSIFDSKFNWGTGGPVKETSARFLWMVPPEGEFRVYHVNADKARPIWRLDGPDKEFQEPKKLATEVVDSKDWPPQTCGYGGLCLLKVPVEKVQVKKVTVEDGILGIPWIEFILAQTSLLSDLDLKDEPIDSGYAMHLASVMFSLGTFSGRWPSRNERSYFAYRSSGQISFFPFRYYLQVHFRCFTRVVNSPEKSESVGATDGLLCKRQSGQINSPRLGVLPHDFKEKRISIFGILSSGGNITNSWNDNPGFYRVLVLAENDVGFPFEQVESSGLKWSAGLEGTIAFHAAVFATMGVWETEWNNVLDYVDECLRIRLDDEIRSLMFDSNFERSKLYFTILRVLLNFSECIRTVSDDLRRLDDLFLKGVPVFPMINMSPDELQVMRSNWESVIEVQKKVEERLIRRVEDKVEEVKSFRDGLFNASSLREANRSTAMNRYVIIFTVVTVLYLPPSFVSAVFGMAIFQKADPAQTTWEYKVTMVSVSLFTYLVAIVSIVAVSTDWGHVRSICSNWWHALGDSGAGDGGAEDSGAGDSARSVPGPQVQAAPESSGSKVEEVANMV